MRKYESDAVVVGNKVINDVQERGIQSMFFSLVEPGHMQSYTTLPPPMGRKSTRRRFVAIKSSRRPYTTITFLVICFFYRGCGNGDCSGVASSRIPSTFPQFKTYIKKFSPRSFSLNQGCAKLIDFECFFGYDFENIRNFRF